MVIQSTHFQIAQCRERVIAWIETWAEPHTLCRHFQDDSLSLQLTDERHLIILPCMQHAPIVVLLAVKVDLPNRDFEFPDRFVTWLREGGDDPLPNAAYALHLNTLGYGIAIPMVDWSLIETQCLPMIDFVFGFLAQLQRCYQVVRDLDLDGDYARKVRDQFHSEARIRRASVPVSCGAMSGMLTIQ